MSAWFETTIRDELTICTFPVLDDNYQYLWITPQRVLAVDCGDAAPFLAWSRSTGRKIDAILVTHDDADHIMGLAALGVPRLPPAQLPSDIQAIPTPGHCAEHWAFYSADAGILFSGDCMFGAGCGRIFGNPPGLMFESLRKLAALPPETQMFFGHEYTVPNLEFAAYLFPRSLEIAARLDRVRAIRAKGIPSAPSTIAEEQATNPFLLAKSVAQFAEWRRKKDEW